MKKLVLLSVAFLFVFAGTQAFASPPITPPVEGFIIHSFTEASVAPLDGKMSFTESEKFNWTYYEGWGKGPFYPNGYVPAGACGFGSVGCCTEDCGATNCNGLVSELGFTEGAEVAYEQTFEAKDGTLDFQKTFDAKSDPDAGDNNLVVNKKIDFEADDPLVGYAKHTEKVGLSVISMGAKDTAANPASGLLTLCPWAAQNGGGSSGGGYPPTNEGIAAGSSFQVTRLVGFESNSVVNSSINPALKYDVTGEGDGKISAGFVVDLWEGPKGYVWAPVPLWKGIDGPDEGTDIGWDEILPNTCCGALGCYCDQAAWISQGKSLADFLANPTPANALQVWQLPQQAYGEPPLASRLHYEEHASAEGTWTFTKQVSYESTLPGAAASATFPFQQVP